MRIQTIGIQDVGDAKDRGKYPLSVPEREWATKVFEDASGYKKAARDLYHEPSLEDYDLITRISPVTARRLREQGLFRGQSGMFAWVIDKLHGSKVMVPGQWLAEWDRDRNTWASANKNPPFDRLIPDPKQLTGGIEKAVIIIGGGWLLLKALGSGKG